MIDQRCSSGPFMCFLYVWEAPLQTLTGWSSRLMADETICADVSELECRDVPLAFHLKLAAIITILFAGAFGVALPLLGRKLTALRTDGSYFAVAKAFAAGVILATGFVHMLPDATEALTDSCLPQYPWKKFPFSGCIAMLATLGTLLVDVLGTDYYEKKHASEARKKQNALTGEWNQEPRSNDCILVKDDNLVSGHSEDDHMHIVGMRAHAASHNHSHPQGHHSCNDSTHEHVHSEFGHSRTTEDVSSHIRHVVVSQVLELGIVTHSVIIGISLGVSQSPCTIRPLFAALSFHQFFEGFALGGCISQAGLKPISTVAMGVCFTMTTPIGIAVGTGIASGYNSNSPGALIVEGIFDSISAGILIYMALVDLIAADFLSKRISCNRILQALSYTSLILGAAAMSVIAAWV